MIAKVVNTVKSGKGFSGLINYLNKEKDVEKKEIEQLGDTMGNESPDMQISILNAVANKNKRVKNNVFHGVLSLHPSEKLSNEKWTEIAHKYMIHMGYDDAPYAIVKHNDTEHQHIHIVGSRIDYQGKTVDDSFSQKESIKFAREIEKEYNLKIVDSTKNANAEKPKSSKEIHAERREGGEKLKKTVLKELLKEAIDSASGDTLQEYYESLESYLIMEDVDIQLHENSSGIFGISYKYDGYIFKASQLGKRFQYKNISAKYLKKATDAAAISKHFEKESRNEVKQLIRDSMKNAKGKTFQEFTSSFGKNMRNSGVNIKTHKYESGEIYGISYLFKENEFKGSSLGDEFKNENLQGELRNAFKEQATSISPGPGTSTALQSGSIPDEEATPNISSHVFKAGVVNNDDEFEEEMRKKKKKKGFSR